MTLHVLRLKRTDDPSASQHIFLHISQQNDSNSKPKAQATTKPTLDLKLIATDEEHIYHGSLLDSETKTLQSTNYPSDLATWKRTLRTALLPSDPSAPPNPTEGPEGDEEEGLELVAAIKSTTLTITLRRNIEGITQRLGTLTLHQDDEREELSPFTWLSISLARNSDLQSALRTRQTAASKHQDQISKLEAQLDEFVRVKKEHEEELVGKFVKVLNAKKGKIRDQARLLAGAKVRKGAGEVVARGRKGVGSAGAVASEELEDDVENEEDSVDERVEGQQETPPRSETEEEDDLDAGFPATQAATKSSSARLGKRKVADLDVELEDENHEPPPRRTLPFADKGSNASDREVAPTAPAPAPALDGNKDDDDDDEDETDDEL